MPIVCLRKVHICNYITVVKRRGRHTNILRALATFVYNPFMSKKHADIGLKGLCHERNIFFDGLQS
jgi:hypothetical protein